MRQERRETRHTCGPIVSGPSRNRVAIHSGVSRGELHVFKTAQTAGDVWILVIRPELPHRD